MVKRLLDCGALDFQSMSKPEILESIRASEGRVIVSEIIGAFQPILSHISNAELAAAFGADILLLNMFDVRRPVFQGLPETENIVQTLKLLTGRLLGINLEPVDADADAVGDSVDVPEGRRASAANAVRACEQGFDMIVLTGNPKTHVSNKAITHALKTIRQTLGNKIILAAGKMHAAGSASEAGENIIGTADVAAFIKAGADIILLPTPGTVPGITLAHIRELVAFSHTKGALTLTTIGTSQEGADEQTIRQMALTNKMTGTDMHHLGDSGLNGIAVPENIMTYSIAIRGRRHTYARMARSINR